MSAGKISGDTGPMTLPGAAAAGQAAQMTPEQLAELKKKLVAAGVTPEQVEAFRRLAERAGRKAVAGERPAATLEQELGEWLREAEDGEALGERARHLKELLSQFEG